MTYRDLIRRLCVIEDNADEMATRLAEPPRISGKHGVIEAIFNKIFG